MRKFSQLTTLLLILSLLTPMLPARAVGAEISAAHASPNSADSLVQRTDSILKTPLASVLDILLRRTDSLLKTSLASVLNIPYISQYTNLGTSSLDCGPASVAMVLDGYGKRPSNWSNDNFVADVRNKTGRLSGGTTPDDLENALSAYGLSHVRVNSVQQIKESLAQNKPVIAFVNGPALGRTYGNPPNHWIVVRGFSDDGLSTYVNDPDQRDLPSWKVSGGQVTWTTNIFNQALTNPGGQPYSISISESIGSSPPPSALPQPTAALPQPTTPPAPTNQSITVVSIFPNGDNFAPGQEFHPDVVVQSNGFSLDCGKDFLEKRDDNLYGTWPNQGCQALGNNRYRIYFNTPMKAPNDAGNYRSRWQIWHYPNHLDSAIEINFSVGSASNPGETNHAPSIPLLQRPYDSAIFNNSVPELCWDASTDPEGDTPVQYFAELVRSVVTENSGWTSNTCWKPTKLSGMYHGYEWRVKARDSKGKESDWSNSLRFILAAPLIPTPTPDPIPPTKIIDFGDGRDGDLVVPAGQTITINPVKVNVSASGSSASPANSTGFAVGDMVIFHQTQSTANVGFYEFNQIKAINGSTSWALAKPLAYAYDNTNGRAQVLKVPQYKNVTVQTGGTLTAPAWDGQNGGIIVFKALGTLDIAAGSQISAKGLGYRGGAGGHRDASVDNRSPTRHGYQGEGHYGPGALSTLANDAGGGGGGADIDSGDGGGGGGGGSHSEYGANGTINPMAPKQAFGLGATTIYGDGSLSNINLGGGGGGGAADDDDREYGGKGGNGSGIAILFCSQVQGGGSINVSGADGSDGTILGKDGAGGGGGGAGGSIKLVAVDSSGVSLHVSGATGGRKIQGNEVQVGGNGGAGRIRVEYCNTESVAVYPSASKQKIACVLPTPTPTNTSTPTNTPTRTATALPLPTVTPTQAPTNGPTPLPTEFPPILGIQGGGGALTLQWQPSTATDVANYRVSRTLTNTVDPQPLATVNGTSYADLPAIIKSSSLAQSQTTLKKGDGACYIVEALRADGTVISKSNLACETFGQTTLWVPEVWGKKGEKVIVPINIGNATGLKIAASEFWLGYDPAIISPTRVLSTSLLAGQYNVATDFAITRTVRIAAYSTSQPQLFGQGSLFWVEFLVKGESGSESPLDLREVIGTASGSNSGGSILYATDNLTSPVPLNLIDGRLRVGDKYQLGDLNGTGTLQADDGTMVLKAAVGQRSATWEQQNVGDVNGDGEIGAADATMIFFRYIKGRWPQASDAPSPSGAALAANPLVSLEDLMGTPGTPISMKLQASNMVGVAGGEFKITYDPKVVQNITTTQSVSLRLYDDHKGLLTIALASSQVATGNGTLATLLFYLAPNTPTGTKTTLKIVDAKFNNLAGQDFETSIFQQTIETKDGTVEVGSTTPTPSPSLSPSPTSAVTTTLTPLTTITVIPSPTRSGPVLCLGLCVTPTPGSVYFLTPTNTATLIPTSTLIPTVSNTPGGNTPIASVSSVPTAMAEGTPTPTWTPDSPKVYLPFVNKAW